MDPWHVDRNGERVQMTIEQLTDAVQRGDVRGGDLVWRDGMPSWLTVADLPVLAAALPASAAAQSDAAAAVGVVGYQQPRSDSIVATEAAILSLRKTKGWVRFLAVLGFIASGLMGIGGMAFAITFSRFSPGAAFATFAAYAVAAGINFALAFMLNRYASKIAVLMTYRREDHLEAALSAQHKFWRLVGLIVLTVIGLYVAALLVALLVSLAM